MIKPKVLMNSFTYSFAGISYVWKHDQNIRFHVFASLVVVALSIFFRVNPFEMGILGVMIVLVLTTEMINSAIEKMVDLITVEHRIEAKVAKDVASGMVLISSVGSVVVGVLIFLPHILQLFR